jgi:YD repeat-containing protein
MKGTAMFLFRNENSRKQIAHILIISFFLEFFLPLLSPALSLKAGDGPAKPEAASFEPVDATDMVNLFTGDLSYNLPLLEVPGPEGSWPINMFYHAGVGPNSEASWVGLGWNLNPGAINRVLNGYPDDYFGGFLNSRYTIQKERKTGFGVSVGVGIGPVGMNVDFDSNQGLVGMNTSLSITKMLGFDGPANLSLTMGSSGVGVSGSLSGSQFMGSKGASLNGSIGLGLHMSTAGDFSSNVYGGLSFSTNKYNGNNKKITSYQFNGAGFNFSSNNQSSFSVAGGARASNSSVVGKMQTNSFNIKIPGIPIPVGPSGLWVSIGANYYEHEWWLDENHTERGFGLLHQSGFAGESLESWASTQSDNAFLEDSNYGKEYLLIDHKWDDSKYMATKFDHSLINNGLFSAADFYQVNVQGLSGNFQPYLKNSHSIYEKKYEEDSDDPSDDWVVKGKLDITTTFNKGKDIRFRFRGELGGQFKSDNASLSDIEDGSKQIRPVIDVKNGQLIGFRIGSEDGKIYEFYQPIQQLYSKDKNWYEGIAKIESFNEVKMNSPYATSWLLTGIKGPDYIDRGENGFSNEDWGYWVKFNYDEKKIRSWRAPHFGYQKSTAEGSDGDMYSTGLKEEQYLESIETTSHIAKFETSDRDDNQNVYLESGTEFFSKHFSKLNGNRYRVELPHKKSEFVNALSSVEYSFSADVMFDLNLYEVEGTPDDFEFVYKGVGIGDLKYEDIDLNHYLSLTENDSNVYFEFTVPDQLGNNHVIGPKACKLILNPVVEKKYSDTKITDLGGDQFEITFPVSFNQLKIEGRAHNIKVRYRYKHGLGIGRPHDTSFPLEEGQYTILDDSNGFTRIHIDGNIIKSTIDKNNVRKFSIRSAQLFVGDQPIPSSRAQKLDSIVLYKKLFNNQGLQTGLSEALTTLKLDYDYTLLTKSPNSIAISKDGVAKNGKLVLKSIKKLGLAGAEIMPATEFSYYGETKQSDYASIHRRLVWDQDSWDLWGGYSSVTDKKKHHNSQEKYIADRDAATGNLSEIRTALGGKILIDYESDVITSVKGKYPPLHQENEITDAVVSQRSEVPQIEVPISDLSVYKQLKDKFESGNLEGLFVAERRYVEVFDKHNEEAGTEVTSYFSNYRSINKFQNSNIYLNNSIHFKENTVTEDNQIRTTTEYTYRVFHGSNYAGGHRVKSLTVFDGDKIRKTEHNYYGGSTYSIPTLYNNNLIDLIGTNGIKENRYSFKDNLYSSNYNILAPAPNVGYAKVEVKEVDPKSGACLNGKSSFSYYNAKSNILNPDIGNLSRPFEYGSYNSGRILDNTTLMGMNYKVEHFGLKKGKTGFVKEDYFPVKADYMIYETSSKIAELENIKFFDKNFDQPIRGHEPGITVQTYKSGEERNGVITSHTKIQTQENLFLIGTASKEYFYDENSDLSGIAETKVNNIGYDMLTGKMLITETKDSQNRTHVTESTPAYWKYPEMAEKNMLSQRAQDKAYLLEENEIFYGLDDNGKKERLINASVNTWRPWTRAYENGKLVETPSNKVWRRDDSYVAVQTGPQFQEFSRWTDYEDDEAGDYQNNHWQRTSNITAYNRYSKVVESRSLDGNYSSSIYGHSDALPIATIVGSKRENSLYMNFEDGESNDVHTGARSKELNGYYEIGRTPSENIGYTVSMWLKPDQGRSLHVFSETINENKWQFVSFKGINRNMVIRVNGQGLVDDLRIHPDNATMTTYNYDPITWKISSITDANNRSIFYEYDDAGRLSRVLDEDKMLLNKTFYHFGKGTN